MEESGVAQNRHVRVKEALGFALCQPIWPSVTTLCLQNKRIQIIRSPNCDAPVWNICEPPLQSAGLPLEQLGKVFDIASAYYRKILDHTAETEHPVSAGAWLVMESLQANLELQLLALGV